MKKIFTLVLAFVVANFYNSLFANAPAISITSKTNITSTSATINYSLFSNGKASTYTLMMGTATPLYSGSNGVQSGSAAASFFGTKTFNATALTPNTKYYVQAVASNADGTTYSTLDSFVTTTPPVITLVGEASIGNNANIFYKLNAKGDSTGVTLKFGTSIPLSNTSINLNAFTNTIDTTLMFRLSGLTGLTKVYYQISATNHSGTTNSVIDSIVVGTTSVNPIITNVTVTPSTNNALVNYDGIANAATTQVFITFGITPTLTNNVTGTALTGLDTTNGTGTIIGLTPNTKYYYAVYISNSNGSVQTITDSFTTTSAVTKPNVTTSAATNIAATTATINYSVKCNLAATTTVIKYGTNASNFSNNVAGYYFTVIATNTFQTAFYNITGLVANTKYYYQIVATNAAGSDSSIIDSFATVGITTGLLAYYNFENNSNSYNGVHNLTSATAISPNYGVGKYGQAANFDVGVQAFSNTSLATAFTGVNEFTVCFWEKRTSVTQYATSYELFGSNFFRTRVAPSSYEFGMGVGAASYIADNASSSVTSNWRHVAIVLGNNNSGTRVLRLYFDGIFDREIVATSQSLYKFNNLFTVGSGTDASGNIQTVKYFNGLIDEMYIYNRALNETSIADVMNNALGILPTNITNISVSNNNNVNTLKWTSENEINVSHFNVQYSSNGKDFETIGKVFAGKKEYSFNHTNLSLPSTNYYKLQIVDNDGKISYSKIVKLNITTKQNFTVELQNTIAKGEANLLIQSNTVKALNINIVNIFGKVLQQFSKVVNAGATNISLSTSSLNTGIYFIVVSDNTGNRITEKMLKN